MKVIFRIEKVMFHNENMILTGVEMRVKLFRQTILSYRLPSNNNYRTA